MLLSAFTWGDFAYLTLGIFLLAVGLTLAYACIRLGGTLAALTTLIQGSQEELLPVVNKVGGTVDRVNGQLDKVDLMTDSAVDAVDHADTAVRAVSMAITRPVQKVSGLAAGIASGASDLKANRNFRGAVDAGKSAATRREVELDEELSAAGREPPP